MKKNEFEEFRAVAAVVPPLGISERIVSRVRTDLNPSAWKVFSKLSLIHFFTALVTLSVCPQFGIRLFGEGMGLMHYFMLLGSTGCALACGSFFIGGSIGVAMMVLRPEEIRVIRRHRLLELGALISLSVGFFVMLRADIVLGFFLAWTIGSWVGGFLTLELAWSVRLRLLQVTA